MKKVVSIVSMVVFAVAIVLSQSPDAMEALINFDFAVACDGCMNAIKDFDFAVACDGCMNAIKDFDLAVACDGCMSAIEEAVGNIS